MEISKADLNSVMHYMEEEQVTIPHHTTGSHTNTIQPRDVPSTPMITVRCSITAMPKNATHTSTVVPTPVIIEPRNVTCSITVMPTPMIAYMSASPDVKVIDNPEVKAVDAPEIKAVNSTLIAQTPLEPPTYNLPPVKQQDVLYDFFHYIDRGTFGIPCGGKTYCLLPGMGAVAQPHL